VKKEALGLVSGPPGGLFSIADEQHPFDWRSPPPLEKGEHLELLTGNRFDAPDGEYLTRYYGADPYTCFVEKLERLRRRDADFEGRVDEALEAAIDELLEEERNDSTALSGEFAGVVPPDLLDRKQLIHVEMAPHARFVDVEDAATLQAAARHLGHEFLARHGLARVDRVVPTNQDRRISRPYALSLWQLAQGSSEAIVGLRFPSTHGGGLDCYVCWNEADDHVVYRDAQPVDLTHRDLIRAAQHFDLAVPVQHVEPLPNDFPSWD
jgi:hypothetical protein